ncbi:hypothetical protein CEE82_12265, partial [Lactobacillus crispatus]
PILGGITPAAGNPKPPSFAGGQEKPNCRRRICGRFILPQCCDAATRLRFSLYAADLLDVV